MSVNMNTPLSIFTAYGIEIEYMIVDRDSMNILPITDKIIHHVAGEYINEIEQGEIAWSNELVLHVIELKTNGPAKSLRGIPGEFQNNLKQVQSILDEMNACLMPTAMHPWMNPYRETQLWPHGQRDIYETFNKIFNCEGHGWSNLQSMHINLPFANDNEFASLHSAIRVLLPILPAMAASSPIVEGHYTRMMDTRLETYRLNSIKIPSITGLVVPDAVSSEKEYQEKILNPMYQEIAPFDPDKILQDEWLNARGAIARFDRNAIEIRILDTQEMPAADLAIASFIIETIKCITNNHWSSRTQQNSIRTDILASIFRDIIINAEQSVIDDRDYLKLFRFPDKKCIAQELWQHLRESIELNEENYPESSKDIVDFILKNGPLARRIINATGKDVKRPALEETYRVLCNNLIQGELFTGIN